MYNFQQIRNALTAVTSPAPGFSFAEGWATSQTAYLQDAPEWQDFLTEMRSEAARARNSPVLPLLFSDFRRFATNGSRQEYEKPYFERRGRLLALALTTIIDDNPDYLETLQNLIWEICNEYTWCLPAHLSLDLDKTNTVHSTPHQTIDLFAAETADALAETLVILGERLDPVIQQRVLAEIENRVFQPLFNNPVHFWWESTLSNWASVCAGSVGMAALLLVKDKERLAGIIDRVVRTLEGFLESYGEDGGCAEGIGYWVYGFGYYVYFAQMLYDFTGGALDLFQSEKIRRMAEFPAGISLSSDNFVNYSDGEVHNVLPPGLISKLHSYFQGSVPQLRSIPSLHSDLCYRWATITRTILWTDRNLFHQPTPAGTVYFPDLALVIDRRYVGETILAFSAKGGYNDEPHNHNDLGHFILHVGGESLLADLGAGLYTRQYFGAERYSILHNSSLGHSVPVINGQEQQAGSQYKAIITRYEAEENGFIFEVNITHAYDTERAGLSRFIRTFQWNYEPDQRIARLGLQDDFQFSSEPATLTENFISLNQPDLKEGQGRVIWQAQNGRVELEYASEQFIAGVEEIRTQNHAGDTLTVFRLKLEAKTPGNSLATSFFFKLIPEA